MNYNTEKEKIAREEPLAKRIVDRLVHDWLTLGLKFAEATTDNEDHWKGALNLYSKLDEYWLELTPSIIDELERAGLLKKAEKDSK